MTMRKITMNHKGGAGVIALMLVILILAVGTAVLVVVDNGSIGKSTSMEAVKITTNDSSSKTDDSSDAIDDSVAEPEPEPEPESLLPTLSDNYKEVNAKKIDSKYCVLIDADTNQIIAGTGYDKKIYPASLTKLMTLLVSAENIDDIKGTFKFTNKIIEPLIEQDASRVGFENGEKVTIRICFTARYCAAAQMLQQHLLSPFQAQRRTLQLS